MKSLSSLQVLHDLAAFKIRLNLVETASVSRDEVRWVLSVQDEGLDLVTYESAKMPLAQYFAGLVEHYSLKEQLTKIPSHLCLITHKLAKTWCSLQGIKEILARKTEYTEITAVQHPHTNLVKFRGLELIYLNNEYTSKYSYKDAQGQDAALQIDEVYADIIDIAKTVIIALEQSYLKRVIHIHLELAIDSSKTVWLLQIPTCKLLEIDICKTYVFKTALDIQSLANSLPKKQNRYERKSLKSSRLANPYAVIKPRKACSYTFKGGRIRSVDSNVNSPIPMRTPVFFREEVPGSWLPKADAPMIKRIAASAKRLYIKPAVLRKGRTMTRLPTLKRAAGFHSDFMESMLKDFTKRKLIPPRMTDSMYDVKYDEFVEALNLHKKPQDQRHSDLPVSHTSRILIPEENQCLTSPGDYSTKLVHKILGLKRKKTSFNKKLLIRGRFLAEKYLANHPN